LTHPAARDDNIEDVLAIPVGAIFR
jgi:hypothetical protein